VQQDVGGLVDQGLHDGGVVHVGADQHGPGVPTGQAVGPIDSSRTWHRADCETVALDKSHHRVAEPGRRLASQQLRPRHFGQFGARCLVDREHVLHPETRHSSPPLKRLAVFRHLRSAEGTGATVGSDCDAPVVTAWGEHHVTALATLDAPAESPPGVESGDVARVRRTDRAVGKSLRVLQRDQQHVVGAVSVQGGLQAQGPLPVVSRAKPRHLVRQRLQGRFQLPGRATVPSRSQ
jgi:hypothetical protein